MSYWKDFIFDEMSCFKLNQKLRLSSSINANNKKGGTKIEPWCTLTVTLAQDEDWPFSITLCFRPFKKLITRYDNFAMNLLNH